MKLHLREILINIKVAVAMLAWSAALGCAIGRAFADYPPLTIWSVLLAAVAATATCAIIVDHVAASATRHLVEQFTAERDATVLATVEAIHGYGEPTADRIIERLEAKQDRTIERVARELVAAMRADAPTPIR